MLNGWPTLAGRQRGWKLYIEDAHYGSLGYDGYGKWEMLEGRFTLAVLFEYAATLGMLDVDYIHPTGARDDFHDNWGGEELDDVDRLAVDLEPLPAVESVSDDHSPGYLPNAAGGARACGMLIEITSR